MDPFFDKADNADTADDSGLYPWLTDSYRRLSEQFQQGLLHHGLLLSGPAGMGKKRLAITLAQRIFCTSPQQGAGCNQCKNCHLFLASHHPDYYLVACEEGKQQIGIDAVRQVQKKLTEKGLTSPYRVVVIDKAESLSLAAANALLKILEEPPSGVFFILCCNDHSGLPATVISRCRLEKFQQLPSKQTLEWIQKRSQGTVNAAQLALFDYSPLRAVAGINGGELELSSQYVTLFSQIILGRPAWAEMEQQLTSAGTPHGVLITWLQLGLLDVLRRQTNHQQALVYPAIERVISEMQTIGAQQLHQLYRALGQLKRQLQDNPGLNKTLQLQKVLLANVTKRNPMS